MFRVVEGHFLGIHWIGWIVLAVLFLIGILMFFAFRSLRIPLSTTEQARKQIKSSKILGTTLMVIGTIIAISGLGAINEFLAETFGFAIIFGIWGRDGLVETSIASLILGIVIIFIGKQLVSVSKTLQQVTDDKDKTPPTS